jgi:hypothetical protein
LYENDNIFPSNIPPTGIIFSSGGVPMTDAEVWVSAKSLIEKYGAKAAMEAAMMADKLLARKDIAAHESWKQITFAVREIEGDRANAN